MTAAPTSASSNVFVFVCLFGDAGLFFVCVCVCVCVCETKRHLERNKLVGEVLGFRLFLNHHR
jgi:hypothetical protein